MHSESAESAEFLNLKDYPFFVLLKTLLKCYTTSRKPSDEEICKSSYVNHLLSKSSCEELLEKDGSVSIHYRNIQALAMEMYKVKPGYTPKIISDLFN